MALAQTDPGVQSGNRGTGGSIIDPGNDPNGFYAFFQDGLTRFQDVESVSNSPTNNNGLGPRFNSNQCSSCHAQPAIGGTGAAVNPQFQFTSNGVAPGSTTPYFITANGPTLEARFPFFFNRNGTVNYNAPNGGVEDLFTVTGRPDAGSCSLPQPSFNAAGQANNIIFRIPTPLFGAGLIENLDDSTLLNNQLANIDLCISNRHQGRKKEGRLEAVTKDAMRSCRFRASVVSWQRVSINSSKLSGRPFASSCLRWRHAHSSGFSSGA